MEAGQDRLWLAREVVRSFARALDGARRIAGATAPTPDPRVEFVKTVRGFVRRHGRLQLEARAQGLSLGSEMLADEQGRFAALATELLVGGVRGLVFEPTVTSEELENLLAALGDGSGDAATRLLEAGLEHIDIRTLEFTPSLERPEGYSQSVREHLAEMQKKSDEIAKDMDAKGVFGKGAIVYELTDSGGELARFEKVQPTPVAATAADDALIAVPPDALKAAQAKVLEGALPEAIVLQLVDLVLQGYTLDPTALGAENAKWFLETAPALALKEGILRLLAGIVERYQMELTVATGVVAATVNGVIQSLGSREGVEKLAALGTATDDIGALCEILEALGEPGIIAALSAYQRTTSKEIREALSGFLASNIAQAPDALKPLLQPTANTETAKFALFLVSKALSGTAADRLYDQAKSHPKAQVSDYASFLWRTTTTRGRLSAFLEALEKNDPAERVRAVDALAKAKDREALEPLVKLVEDASFLSRTPEEMHAFMNAISEIGGPAMLRFFERQSERSSGIFRIRAGNEVRETAKELLRRLVEQGNQAQKPNPANASSGAHKLPANPAKASSGAHKLPANPASASSGAHKLPPPAARPAGGSGTIKPPSAPVKPATGSGSNELPPNPANQAKQGKKS